jgi:hypothetical protein
VNNLLSEVRQAQGVFGLARPDDLTDDLRDLEGHSATDAVTLGSGSWVIVVYNVMLDYWYMKVNGSGCCWRCSLPLPPPGGRGTGP